VSPLPWKSALGATLAVAALLALGTLRLPSAAVWSDLTPGDCAEYCERSADCGELASRDAIQQPLNAWSNLAYLFVGLLAWRRPLRPTAALFALSSFVLAAGSFLFHAAVTREFQWLDMVGTYGVLVAVFAHGLVAAFGLASGAVVAGAVALDALIAIFKWRLDAYVVLPLLLLATAVPITAFVQAGRRSARAAIVPAVLFAAAFLVRQLDVDRIGCQPESLLYQGHALWHLLTAASLGWAFFFFDAAPKRDAT
jgi:hypothetical protein